MEDSLRRSNTQDGELSAQPSLVLVHQGTGANTQPPVGDRNISVAPPLPFAAKILSISVFLVGAAVVAFYARQLPHSGLVGLVLLTAMAAASERLSIIAYKETWVSISFVCLFAIAVLYGPAGIAVAEPLVVVSLHFPHRMLPHRLMFNFGAGVLADVSAALILTTALTRNADLTLSPQLLAVALAAAAADYGIRTTLISTVAGLTMNQRPWTVWLQDFQWLLPHFVVFGFLGLAMAVAYQQIGVTGLVAFAAPPLMMRFAIKQYVDQTTRNVGMLKRRNEQLQKANRDILAMSDRLKETYEATLEALAAALDARDSETGGHSNRVTIYTMEMAREMGVIEGSDEWLDIERASLLHDVGKIGVSDAILNKPGPLTAEEWQQMRKHPAIGYEMLKDVKFLSVAAEIVYTHHERYDGRGYPASLQGESIPLGARVFAVADAFDAMTSNRPYRRALTVDQACEEITSNSGTQFDPLVVQAFLRCLPSWAITVRERVAA